MATEVAEAISVPVGHTYRKGELTQVAMLDILAEWRDPAVIASLATGISSMRFYET
jgi:hypothetical protein